MKNNRLKSLFALLLTVAVMLGISVTAMAADSTVTFTEGKVIAFAPGTATSSDLFDGFKGVMPGDVLEENITIKNSNSEFDYLKVYLRAVPHDEENAPITEGLTAADSNDFLSQLSMKVWNGTSLIFSDSPDNPGALAADVFLGQIAKDESIELKAELSVPIELDNEYADRMGEVDWEFTFEGYDTDILSVRKTWSGDITNHPDSVQVQLYKGNDVFDTQTLNAGNQWSYVWSDLDNDFAWDVKEVSIDGYTPTYTKEGNDIHIDNYKPGPTPPPIEYNDLTVNKRWDNGDRRHPDSVTVTLYNGNVAYDKITLSAANSWSHTWRQLPSTGQWRVVETNINGGYVPFYSTNGNVVTITNSVKLIQTGQLSWPIPVLSGLGILLIGYGIYTAMRKRKDSNV